MPEPEEEITDFQALCRSGHLVQRELGGDVQRVGQGVHLRPRAQQPHGAQVAVALHQLALQQVCHPSGVRLRKVHGVWDRQGPTLIPGLGKVQQQIRTPPLLTEGASAAGTCQLGSAMPMRQLPRGQGTASPINRSAALPGDASHLPMQSGASALVCNARHMT